MSTEMSLPRPYGRSDDAALVEACLRDDEEAWAELRRRHGTLVSLAVVRALDGPRAEEVDLDAVLALVWDRVHESALERWSGESQLRTYLAVVGRHAAREHAPSTSPRPLVAPVPTPSGLLLDDLLALEPAALEPAALEPTALEPAARVQEALDRLPPNVATLVRLRLQGLSRDDIAATLGMSPQAVSHNLERIAERLGEDEGARLDTSACWRALLDAAAVAERVTLAVRTTGDAELGRLRSRVEKTWRAVGERALSRPVQTGDDCLDDLVTAGFVDGTLRGAARARAEGHVASCPRCVDEVAALVIDLRALTVLREAAALSPITAVAAACVATTCFAAAERLARRAGELGVDERAVTDLRRLAQAGRHLEGRTAPRPEQTSQVVATHVPADDEAPLIAFEALVLGDPRTAWRAIDDHLAKHGICARLRLLAASGGPDLDGARALAETQLATPRIDPGHAADAAAVVALPRGVALPREILVERLRVLLPELVRFVLSAS